MYFCNTCYKNCIHKSNDTCDKNCFHKCNNICDKNCNNKYNNNELIKPNIILKCSDNEVTKNNTTEQCKKTSKKINVVYLQQMIFSI